MREILRYFTIVFLLATLMALSSVRAIAQQELTGAIQGRLVWPDNSGIENAHVKIVDKLNIYIGRMPAYYSVQKVAIANDALVKKGRSDRNGRFRFTELPPGKYYLFYKVIDAYESDDWIYPYQHGELLHLAGYMEKPDSHIVKSGEVTTIEEIEVIRRLYAPLPSKLTDKDGFYRFSWSRYGIDDFFRLSLRHQDYDSNLQHSAYRAHEVGGTSYTNGEALFPGRHEFQFEELDGKTLSVYAKSLWIEFTVPGEVLKLNIEKDQQDSTGRTISWGGSDAIKTVKVTSNAGGYKTLIKKRTIQLPVAPGKRFELRACDKDGKELVPGWVVDYYQPDSK